MPLNNDISLLILLYFKINFAMLSVREIFLFTTRTLAVMHTVFCLIVTGDTSLRNNDVRSVTSANLRVRAILLHVHYVYFCVWFI